MSGRGMHRHICRGRADISKDELVVTSKEGPDTRPLPVNGGFQPLRGDHARRTIHVPKRFERTQHEAIS